MGQSCWDIISLRCTHFDTTNSRLIVVDNDRIDIPSENSHDRCIVLVVRRLAQIDHATFDARKRSTEIGERRFKLGLSVTVLLIRPGRLQLSHAFEEFFVVLRFLLTD